MNLIIRTAGRTYKIKCDNLTERTKQDITWLVLKEAGEDKYRFNMDYIESIQFIEQFITMIDIMW